MHLHIRTPLRAISRRLFSLRAITLAAFAAVSLLAGSLLLLTPGATLHAQEDVAPVTGRLALVWGDRYDSGASAPAATMLAATLTTAAGEQMALELTPELLAAAGEPGVLQGALVEVHGQMNAAGMLDVRALTFLAPADVAGRPGWSSVLGSQPWIVLLCRGEGASIVHEDPLPHYQALMGSAPYGADHYWRELSYGKTNILGTTSAGWFALPEPASAYRKEFNGGYTLDSVKATNDCIGAADPLINFSPYVGIVLIAPLPNPNSSASYWFFGGGTVLTLDGQQRFFRMTWMPMEIGPRDDEALTAGASVLMHEMGHGFGLPHSSGPYEATYDSAWDVMSNSEPGACRSYDSPYPFGCPGQHTIAAHKEWLDWIEPQQVVTLADNSSVEVLLNPMALPDGSGPLLIKSPIAGAERYYTVEARLHRGYDGLLSDEAVVIHEVDLSRRARTAQVVDPDGDGYPNDAAAQWQPGERFDGEGGFTLCVKGRTPQGYLVLAARNQPLTCTFAPNLDPSSFSTDVPFPTAGQTVTLQLDLVNYQAPAANVVVTATLPGAVTYITGTAATSAGSVRLAGKNQLVFSVGDLTYQEPITLSYAAVVNSTVTKPTVIRHSSAVTWEGGAATWQMVAIANATPLYLPVLRR